MTLKRPGEVRRRERGREKCRQREVQARRVRTPMRTWNPIRRERQLGNTCQFDIIFFLFSKGKEEYFNINLMTFIKIKKVRL